MPEQVCRSISISIELLPTLILKSIEIAVADELLFLVKDANALFFSVIRIDGRVLVLVDKVMRGGHIVIIIRPAVCKSSRRGDITAENIRKTLCTSLSAKARPKDGRKRQRRDKLHLHGIARIQNENDTFIVFDRRQKFRFFPFREIILPGNGLVVLIFARTA